MNAEDTVAAVKAEVHALRAHDRQTGQDSRWEGLDAVPDAVARALKKHGGRITHDFLYSEFSKDTTESGVPVERGMAIIRFSIHGSEGEPVTGDVAAEATQKGDNAGAKVYKRALKTFLVTLLELPNNRADPDSQVYEKEHYLVKSPKLPKSQPKYFSRIKDIPSSPMTEAAGARIAGLTVDEYAVEWAKYYLEALSVDQHPIAHRFLVTELQEVGFSDSEAEHGAVEALRSFGIDVDTEKDRGVSSE
jgi:hypothetical protein|tara:strand:+ start:160 stop:903 length:744 start_codon:yes stop_codon:yes gene_type:complete